MAYDLPKVKRIGIGKLTLWEAKKPKTIEELKEEKEFLEAKEKFREEVKQKTAEKEKLEKDIAHLKGEDKKIQLPESFKKGFKKEARLFLKGAGMETKRYREDFAKGYNKEINK